MRRLPLCLQGFDSYSFRNAVERHIDYSRHAAGGRGACGRLKPFPIGAPRLVDVNVSIDEARHHHRILAGFNYLAIGRNLIECRYGDDAAIAYMHRRRADCILSHNPAPANNEFCFRHFGLRPACRWRRR